MEDQSLNFDRPFLSVRRRTPTLPSEQREDKRKANFSRHSIPQLPPKRSELKSGPIRNPGSVPFLWEQTPGQPKEEAKPDALLTQDRPPLAPKLPPGRYPKDCDKPCPSTNVAKNQDVIIPATSDNKTETFNVNNENVEKESSKETREEGSSDSGDNDTFVDALDTLSRATESTFLNCSITDVNELDDLDVTSSGIFSTDPQAQKFMMDRFLPAAKAMASDTLHYAPKRQPIVQEQLKEVNKKVNQCKPSLRYGPSFAKRYSEYRDNEEEEEEDSEDDGDRPEYMRTACGLLPRFCLKGSIGRLNPVPGMSVRTRTPISSYKTRNRLRSAGSYGETCNEVRSDTAEMKSVERIQETELANITAQLRNKNNQFEARTTAAYCGSPWSFLETKKVPSDPEEPTNDGNNEPGPYGKGFKTFQEVLADRGIEKELDSGSSVVEKTVYVDTIKKLETVNLVSPSHDHTITTKKMDQIRTTDSTADDFKEFDDAGEKSVPGAKTYDESSISSSLEPSKETHTMEAPNATTTSTETMIPVNEPSDNSEKQLPIYPDLLAPPPLPKSPSDSWLLRTLPGISKNSSSLHSHAAKSPQNQGVNDVKWETIIKATKSQHHHMHHSVGVLATIPEA